MQLIVIYDLISRQVSMQNFDFHMGVVYIKRHDCCFSKNFLFKTMSSDVTFAASETDE